jgi:hypothetical protein
MPVSLRFDRDIERAAQGLYSYFPLPYHCSQCLCVLRRIKMASHADIFGKMQVFICVYSKPVCITVRQVIIIIIIFHSVCNLNGYDSRNITITFS